MILEKALKNIEQLLPKTSFGGWNFGEEANSWHKCLLLVQSMPGASKKLKIIANERKVEQLLDTLVEIKFAVIFNQLGFQVEFEPLLKENNISLYPDLKITRDDHTSIVEIKRFRAPGIHSPGQRMQNLPKEILKDYELPQIGDPKKDLQKIFNELEKKFRQARNEGIIAFWNNNNELTPHEFLAAANSHKKTSDHHNMASFLIVRSDPWEKFTIVELQENVRSIHKQWKSDLENIVPEEILQRFFIWSKFE